MAGATWLNGSFVERDDARISAFDAGLQHGVGLFDTSLAVDGRIPWLGRRVDRLRDSARALGLSSALRAPALGEAMLACAARAALPRARVRVTITGGDLNLLTGARNGDQTPHDPTILIDAQPATEYPDTFFSEGVRTVIADLRVNPLDATQGHKTLSYWPRLRELQAAARRRAGEAIVFQVSNHLAGGAVSNVFLVKDGELRTPIARGEEESGGLPSPVLPGVTRRAMLDIADDLGIPWSARMLSIEDLLSADEVFLTNSSWGALPVVGVEAESIGPGAPGEITDRLRTEWRARVEREE